MEQLLDKAIETGGMVKLSYYGDRKINTIVFQSRERDIKVKRSSADLIENMEEVIKLLNNGKGKKNNDTK